MLRILCVLVFLGCLMATAQAQIKPGKEKLEIDLPESVRWRTKKIPKDTRAIRGFEHFARPRDTAGLAVQSLELTTIDKRYFPIRARETVQQKVAFYKSSCEDAALQVLTQEQREHGSWIVYMVRTFGESDCLPEVFIGLAAEGPTAFHSVEILVPAERVTDELIAQWTDILGSARIR